MLLFLVPLHCIVFGHGWPIRLLDVTITSLKMMLGLCRTRHDEIWNYLKRKDARVVGLGRLRRCTSSTLSEWESFLDKHCHILSLHLMCLHRKTWYGDQYMPGESNAIQHLLIVFNVYKVAVRSSSCSWHRASI